MKPKGASEHGEEPDRRSVIRTAGDEAAVPKYAQVERERRWLVDPARRPDLTGCASLLIEDRYIIGTRFRLRRMTGDDLVSLKLTKKYDAPDPLARPIVTAYLTGTEYDLVATLPAACLTKRRYKVDGFSVDVFEDALAGLELAEIEAADDAALRALPAPAWTIRDVSAEPGYQGAALALYGRPEN